MTSVVLGWAGDPSYRSPMGIAVIGGLVVSTAMSLFIVPALFTVFDDVQQWLARVLGGRARTAEGEAPAAPPVAVG